MSKKAKTSYLWSYFSIKDVDKKVAQCDICSQMLNFKTTVTNLRKHLERRHPLVSLPKPNQSQSRENNECSLNNPNNQPSSSQAQASSSTSTSSTVTEAEPTVDYPQGRPKSLSSAQQTNQTSINAFLPSSKKISEVQKKKLDKLILQLFTDDFQPFTVVEDRGFKKFVKGLNPSYNLPDRKTIRNSLLPAEFEICFNNVRKELSAIESVCLSTDCWTSVTMDSYLGVTAHFINDNFELRSVLLECSLLPTSHTSINLADAIKRIIDKFNLSSKSLAIVSDNASDISGAITNHLKKRHFGCFAHTLNLICQKALKVPEELVSKIKTIVSYFKRSSSGLQKLTAAQRNLGLEPKKLCQEVSTRWNSTFYMLKRFHELKDAIKTTLALINKDNLPVLTEDEWMTCSDLITVLEPMEDVTRKISGEKYMTGSLVIPLANGLKTVYDEIINETTRDIAKQVAKEILSGLTVRLVNIESSRSLAIATFLDPRFKLATFMNDSSASAIKQHCQSLLADIWKQKHDAQKETMVDVNTQEIDHDETEESNKKKYSVWERLEVKIASKNITGNKTSSAIIEINRYLEESYLERKRDPLLWWKENQCYYPLMATLVKNKFNMIGSSVPCERLFSKAGNFITDRRSRLKPSNVEKLLFLNANSNAI